LMTRISEASNSLRLSDFKGIVSHFEQYLWQKKKEKLPMVVIHGHQAWKAIVECWLQLAYSSISYMLSFQLFNKI
jgi:hypothetical protein